MPNHLAYANTYLRLALANLWLAGARRDAARLAGREGHVDVPRRYGRPGVSTTAARSDLGSLPVPVVYHTLHPRPERQEDAANPLIQPYGLAATTAYRYWVPGDGAATEYRQERANERAGRVQPTHSEKRAGGAGVGAYTRQCAAWGRDPLGPLFARAAAADDKADRIAAAKEEKARARAMAYQALAH